MWSHSACCACCSTSASEPGCATHRFAVVACQVLPLAGMTLAAPSCLDGGGVAVAAGREGAVRVLRPLPFRQQAEALADAGEFEEALRLAQLMPDAQVLPVPGGLQAASVPSTAALFSCCDLCSCPGLRGNPARSGRGTEVLQLL